MYQIFPAASWGQKIEEGGEGREGKRMLLWTCSTMRLFQRTVQKRGSFSILFKIRLDKTFSVSKLWENDNGRWKQSFWSVNEVWTGSLPQDNRKKVNSPVLLAHCIHISYLMKTSSFTKHMLSQKSSPAARCDSVKILTFYLLKGIFNYRKRKQALSL